MTIVINYSYENILNIAAIAAVTASVEDTWMSLYSCCNISISTCKNQLSFVFVTTDCNCHHFWWEIYIYIYIYIYVYICIYICTYIMSARVRINTYLESHFGNSIQTRLDFLSRKSTN